MSEKLKIKDGKVGKNVGFERIRRITGYLVGRLDRFNNAKRAEVEDRVKHSINEEKRSEKSFK
ncbi:MAG: anaerobic ribonucleoside-triphosphate reductase [Alphaproteobacteria bacterium]